MEWRSLNESGGYKQYSLTFQEEVAQDDRVPTFNRYVCHDDFYIDCVVNTSNKSTNNNDTVNNNHSNANVTKSLRDRTKQRVNDSIFNVIQHQGIACQLLWRAVLECLQETWHQKVSSSNLEFTISTLLERIQAGVHLVWNTQRASRRSTDSRPLWQVTRGGRVALYLENELTVFATPNPHIVVEGYQILEFLFRKKYAWDGIEAWQLLWEQPFDTNQLSKADVQIVAHVMEVDPNWLIDSQLQVVATKNDNSTNKKFTIELKNDRLERDIQRQHQAALEQQRIAAEWERFRSKHTNGYMVPVDNTTNNNNNSWLQVAKSQLPVFSTVETTTSGRRTAGVYYGSLSSTPKQLQELVLRTLSLGPKTLNELLLSDEQSNSKRLRSALGTLFWKRNQISRITVSTDRDPFPPTPTTAASRLDQYVYQLQVTEGQLRTRIVQALVHVKPEWIAVAADEGGDQNTVELDSIWQTSGHEWVSQPLWRPPNTEYTIDAWLPRIPVDGHVPGLVGRAKESPLMERRLLFRAVSSTDSILLSEAQVVAGMEAWKVKRQNSNAVVGRQPHPLPATTEVAFFQDTVQKLVGTVVGHTTTMEGQHKILVLPKRADATAFWGTLLDTAEGLMCETDTQRYSVQQFDFDESSAAYQECLKIVRYLQKHPKGAVFQEPVDPIRLGIPQYPLIVKHPMDVSTLLSKLQRGDYSTPPPISSNPIVRMLNGPFRKDVELIFDNAILFNPPDDWIHLAAIAIKKAVLKKMEQAGQGNSFAQQQRSVYVDDDSDVDMYEYESDEDDTGGGGRRRKHKRKRGGGKPPPKEDRSARVIEGGVHLLGGNMLGLKVVSNANAFTLPPEWGCRFKPATNEVNDTSELDRLTELYKQLGDVDPQVVGVRRSTRAAEHQHEKESSGPPGIEYFCADTEERPSSRLEVEVECERLHEEYAKEYRHSGRSEYAPSGVFPPFLGRIVGDHWEIREEKAQAALRWVVRGLIRSQHVSELEPLDGPDGGVIIPNNVYYVDDTKEPYDQLVVRQVRKAESSESEEEQVLSAYEQARAERVERNKQRLEMLGLV